MDKPVNPVFSASPGATSAEDILVKKMVETGVHYGRKKTVTHPDMKRYVVPMTAHTEIFDLTKTKSGLDEAVKFISKTITGGKQILFVGTKPAAYQAVKEIAEALHQPYVVERWVGGLLTNFETVKTRIVYMHDLQKKRDAKEIDKYPIAEKLKLLKTLSKLEKLYSGIDKMQGLPGAIFIADLKYSQHRTAYREAIRSKISIIALVGSDNPLKHVTVIIPGNDKAPKSIAFIVGYVKEKVLALMGKASESEVTNGNTETKTIEG